MPVLLPTENDPAKLIHGDWEPVILARKPLAGVAALKEGFRFIGIDIEREYIDIARSRVLRNEDE